jgi:hypothetical protein
MCKTYLKREFNLHERNDDLWALVDNEVVDYGHRAVLFMTTDYAVVEPHEFFGFGLHCKHIAPELIKKTNWDWSHWEAIGEDLIQLSKRHDRRMIGAGLSCTSVSDIWAEWRGLGKGHTPHRMPLEGTKKGHNQGTSPERPTE